MRIFDFFTIIYDEVFILQLLAVSFSIVWIFYDWKKETKNIAIGIAYICGTFLVGTLLNWLLFALSTVWRAVAGIHFQIAWLLTIFLYLGIFHDHIPATLDHAQPTIAGIGKKQGTE